jgi:Leucine-rich repeat (LRR) protein
MPEGTGTISPESTLYNKGTEVEIKAVPGIHYVFKNWSGDAAGDENPMSVVMTDDMVVTANFEKRTYALTVEIVGEGTVKEEIVQAKSSNDYPALTQVQLTATPDEGWEFWDWFIVETKSMITENPTVVTLTGAKTVRVLFFKVETLTIEIEGEGTVNEEVIFNKSSTDYASGTTVQLTAIPDQDWEFVKWKGDYESFENPLEVLMDQPMSLTAVFQPFNQEKVFIPDDKFEQALIDLGLDDELDDQVDANKAKSLEELDLEGLGINDLTGIEAFESLRTLIVSNNNLTSLDLSNKPLLGSLYCDKNQLVSLDISPTIILDPNKFLATENPLSCVQISLTQLNTGSWIGPGAFAAALAIDNGVTYSIDCSVSAAEKTFVPDDNLEQALIDMLIDDFMDNYVRTANIVNRRSLDISGRNISDLTGLEAFQALVDLNASNNNLTYLDISGWPMNTLSWGVFPRIDLTDNPLKCVQINENQISKSGVQMMFILVDEDVPISLDCSIHDQEKTYVPDDAFEQALIDLGLDDVMDDYVKTNNIVNLVELDISGKNISNLTGLEAFISLQDLNFSNNNVSDVSSLAGLDRIINLDCSNNIISAIPKSFGVVWGIFPPFAPGKLDLSNNKLSFLDVSELNFFTYLDVRNNPLSCIQVNEDQIMAYIDDPNIYTDEGVIFSLDCGN